jgi:hypothetical protein
LKSLACLLSDACAAIPPQPPFHVIPGSRTATASRPDPVCPEFAAFALTEPINPRGRLDLRYYV